VRAIDELGRVVIPKELRDVLGYTERQPLEFLVDENGDVILRKFERGCVFCGEVDDVIEFRGKLVCTACVAELNK